MRNCGEMSCHVSYPDWWYQRINRVISGNCISGASQSVKSFPFCNWSFQFVSKKCRIRFVVSNVLHSTSSVNINSIHVLFGSCFFVLYILLITFPRLNMACIGKSMVKLQQNKQIENLRWCILATNLIKNWTDFDLEFNVCWFLNWIHRSSQLCSLLSV